MTRFDAIIIGGGINGLVAGTVLARRGKRVCILEQAGTLGGMAMLRDADGPTLAHTLYNLSPAIRRDIGLDHHRWPFATEPVPTVSLDDRGRHVVLRGREIRYADDSAHPDANACRALLQRLQGYGDLLRRLAEAPPPGGGGLAQAWKLARFGLGVTGLGKAQMRRFLQSLLSNAYDLLLDDLPDGPVAGLLAADAVRGLATGPRSPGTVLSLIYRLGHGGEVRLPTGGMGAVFDALEVAAKQAGCVIETGTAVQRIVIEGDAVTGVEMADGTTHAAPTILSSAAPQVVHALTGTDHFDIEASRRIRSIRARGTTAKVNLKLDRVPPLPGLPEALMRSRLVIAPSADAVEAAFNPAKYGQMSDAPVIEAVLTEPQPGEVWLSAIVQYMPSDLDGGWTDAAKDALLSRVMDRLAAYWPDLGSHVSASQVITPDRIEADTGAPGGHWHHAELALDQLFTLRPANGIGRYAMGPAGLYLCGAATHPGGDIMGLSGRNAALAVLEDLA